MVWPRARRASPMIVTACICAAAVVPAGCGDAARRASSAASGPCPIKAQSAMARFLALDSRRVAGARSIGNNGSPQCLWSAVASDGAPVTTLVNVYSGPQPYFILERTIVEDSQVFTPSPLYPPPVSVPGLGLEASWFPQYPYLMTTDGYRLLTVTVRWAHHPQSVERALAVAVARTYLHTPHGKVAQRIANGYPSG